MLAHLGWLTSGPQETLTHALSQQLWECRPNPAQQQLSFIDSQSESHPLDFPGRKKVDKVPSSLQCLSKWSDGAPPMLWQEASLLIQSPHGMGKGHTAQQQLFPKRFISRFYLKLHFLCLFCFYSYSSILNLQCCVSCKCTAK